MIDGNQLKAFRDAKGWTLYQLKQATGAHQGLLARIEKGLIKNLDTQIEADIRAVMEGRAPAIRSVDPLTPSSLPPSHPTLPQRLALEPTMHVSLEYSAECLAEHVTSCDPTWGNRLEIMKSERGFTTLQAVVTCLAYVLEQGLHMSIVKHDLLEPSPWRRGDKVECPQCHTLYSPGYPGQPYCGNACAEQARNVCVG